MAGADDRPEVSALELDVEPVGGMSRRVAVWKKWVNGVARHLRYAAQQVGHANPKLVLVKEVVSRNSAQIWTCKLVSRVQSRQSMRAAKINVVSKFSSYMHTLRERKRQD